MNDTQRINWNLFSGLAVIIINSFCLIFNLILFYNYHFTGILYLFMFPDWVLVLSIFLCSIGILIGICVIKHKIKISTGIIMNVALWTIMLLIRY